MMMLRKKASTKPAKFDFEAAAENLTYLRLRNLSMQIVALPSTTPGTPDIFLTPQQEIVVPGKEWSKNRNLRTVFKTGVLELEWVDESYAPRALPIVTDAPIDFMPESAFDQSYAMQVALQTDLETTLDLINHDVNNPDTGETDVTFMKTRMRRILRTVEWLELQLQKRAQVLSVLKARIHWIRSL